jgi:hypothetical protein
MRRWRVSLFLAALAALLTVGGAAAGGVSGPAFYVDGVLYRTVGTPTDLADTGAPDQSFDTMYNFFGAQPYNDATAAPGDRAFNGGRWRVHRVTFNTDAPTTIAAHDANGSGDLDSAAEVLAALADAGPAGATDLGVVREFVCTVNKLPRQY